MPELLLPITIGANGLGKPDAFGYSGQTYIVIHPGKHNFSTALAHGMDFEKFLLHSSFEFDSLTKTENSVKPGHFDFIRNEIGILIEAAFHHFNKPENDRKWRVLFGFLAVNNSANKP
jgi:hypothetical protein